MRFFCRSWYPGPGLCPVSSPSGGSEDVPTSLPHHHHPTSTKKKPNTFFLSRLLSGASFLITCIHFFLCFLVFCYVSKNTDAHRSGKRSSRRLLSLRRHSEFTGGEERIPQPLGVMHCGRCAGIADATLSAD